MNELLYDKEQFPEEFYDPGLACPHAPILGGRDHSGMELKPFLSLVFNC